ncbi:hypothetical protein CRG98_002373 [Punica granatum]|uniref:Uncharacterized protein n=2 Tax=Punica granatum TaxID=22663 RepID=A0A2I0L983_PUNGR|nr:hypothetical protein CRG98_002373 [Punica granatum]
MLMKHMPQTTPVTPESRLRPSGPLGSGLAHAPTLLQPSLLSNPSLRRNWHVLHWFMCAQKCLITAIKEVGTALGEATVVLEGTVAPGEGMVVLVEGMVAPGEGMVVLVEGMVAPVETTVMTRATETMAMEEAMVMTMAMTMAMEEARVVQVVEVRAAMEGTVALAAKGLGDMVTEGTDRIPR